MHRKHHIPFLMTIQKRVTVYLPPEIHEELRKKKLLTHVPISAQLLMAYEAGKVKK